MNLDSHDRKYMSRRCEDERAEFLCKVMHIPASMFVFVDETGSNQHNLHREHGTAPLSLKFQTVNGKRMSAIAAMSTNGVEDFHLVEGSVNGEIFCEYLRNSLLPILQPFNGTNKCVIFACEVGRQLISYKSTRGSRYTVHCTVLPRARINGLARDNTTVRKSCAA